MARFDGQRPGIHRSGIAPELEDIFALFEQRGIDSQGVPPVDVEFRRHRFDFGAVYRDPERYTGVRPGSGHEIEFSRGFGRGEFELLAGASEGSQLFGQRRDGMALFSVVEFAHRMFEGNG